MNRTVLVGFVALAACPGKTVDGPTGPVLESLELIPASLLLFGGDSTQITARGTFSDDAVEDLTASVEWRSSAAGVATVDGGLVTARAAGSAVVSAEDPETGVTATCDVEVVTAEVTGVVVAPATVSIALGRTQELTATATLDDGTSVDVTTSVTWSSTDEGVVTVTAGGVIEGVAEGEADVEATLAGYTGRAEITVTPPEVDTIELVPATLEVAVGRSATMEAFGTLTDGSGPVDITAQTIWESDTPSVARIDGAGLISGVALGSATVTVTFAATGAEGSAPVSVVAAALDHIDITPSNATVGYERYTTFTATGVYSDESSEVLTTGIEWDTLDSGVATIDASGELYGVAWGSTTVTATHTATGIVGSTGVTVAYAAEGADDAPVEITPPYEGQVDTTSSFYLVTGLTPGLVYTVSVDGNDDIDLIVYSDEFVTRACDSSSFGNQESCDAQAPASGSLYIEIRGFGASTNPGAAFTITLSAGIAAPDLTIVLTAVSGTGTMVTFDYTITNEGTGSFAGGMVNVCFWANAASAPDPGVMGPFINIASVPALAPSATYSGSSFSGSSTTSGTAYASVDYSESVLESDDDNNVSPGFSW
jgi:hypothetical protein